MAPLAGHQSRAGGAVFILGRQRRERMRKRLTIAAALALMTLPFVPATAQTPRTGGGEMAMDVVPMLTVSGSGEARVAPDEATVRLGVVAQAPTARAAQDQVNRAAG